MATRKPAIRTALVTTRISPKLLRLLDRAAKGYGITRSTLLEMWIEQMLGESKS